MLKAEAERVAVVEKVKPSVVAVFGAGGQGGGSGVLISDDGYALTNFHVVAGSGPVMQCGLPDGVLYDAVLVGIDKVGDVALIKLYPKKEGHKFPHAVMGDSDKLKEGDWSLAMGNPFLLATDFTPTVTYGLVSGVHRYQYPSGVLLEYTDCIQIDTSINPGNSGGPLFNMQGELIGINGRGSFDKRPRINSGVGYAISINQIKNFMGHLHAGLDVDHATPGFAVTTQTDKSGIGRMDGDADARQRPTSLRRGLTYGDELVSFDGRPIFSVNHFKNVLGLFPRGWRVPMEYRRPGDEEGRKEILVRLMGVQRKVIVDPEDPKGGPPSPRAADQAGRQEFAGGQVLPRQGRVSPTTTSTRKNQDELLAKNLKKQGDFAKFRRQMGAGRARSSCSKSNTTSPFTPGDGRARKPRSANRSNPWSASRWPACSSALRAVPDADAGQKHEDYLKPQGSGGLLAAIFLYRNLLLLKGDKALRANSSTAATSRIIRHSADRKKTLKRTQSHCAEVINAKAEPYIVKFFFNLKATDQGNAGRLRVPEVRMATTRIPARSISRRLQASR